MTWIDPWGWVKDPWPRGGFDDWFDNKATINDINHINQNIETVKRALRNGDGKHEKFPVALATKVKSLGFTAQELKAMTVSTKDIYFVDIENKKLVL